MTAEQYIMVKLRAEANIKASGYAVVKVERSPDCQIKIEADETSLVL